MRGCIGAEVALLVFAFMVTGQLVLLLTDHAVHVSFGFSPRTCPAALRAPPERPVVLVDVPYAGVALSKGVRANTSLAVCQQQLSCLHDSSNDVVVLSQPMSTFLAALDEPTAAVWPELAKILFVDDPLHIAMLAYVRDAAKKNHILSRGKIPAAAWLRFGACNPLIRHLSPEPCVCSTGESLQHFDRRGVGRMMRSRSSMAVCNETHLHGTMRMLDSMFAGVRAREDESIHGFQLLVGPKVGDALNPLTDAISLKRWQDPAADPFRLSPDDMREVHLQSSLDYALYEYAWNLMDCRLNTHLRHLPEPRAAPAAADEAKATPKAGKSGGGKTGDGKAGGATKKEGPKGKGGPKNGGSAGAKGKDKSGSKPKGAGKKKKKAK